MLGEHGPRASAMSGWEGEAVRSSSEAVARVSRGLVLTEGTGERTVSC